MRASAGVVLLVALAWVATPAALAVGPAQPGSPLFFKLQGLLAPSGLTPEVVGMEESQVQQEAQRLRMSQMDAELASTPAPAPAPQRARLASVRPLCSTCKTINASHTPCWRAATG